MSVATYVVFIAVASAGLMMDIVTANAQSPSCSQDPAIYSSQFFDALTSGRSPERLVSELSNQTRDSVSPDDVEHVQSELRVPRGRRPFFKGPIVEEVERKYIQNLADNNKIRDYAQVSFMVESGDESGLSRLTFLLHCIENKWYVAGIRLVPFN